MKRKVISSVCILLGITIIIVFYLYERQKTTVITFGMFTGSNWDVPNGDTYEIIDQAIERFEQSHDRANIWNRELWLRR